MSITPVTTSLIPASPNGGLHAKPYALVFQDNSETTEIERHERQHQTQALTVRLVEHAQSSETTLTIESQHSVVELPPELGRATKTKRLKIEHNYQLRALPETIGFLQDRLEELSLSYNCLPVLPAALTDLHLLKVLNLSNNRLRYLPSDIDRLRHLEDLDVQCNYLTAFPPEIIYLRKMKRLQVHNNPWVDEEDQPPQPFIPPDSQVACTLCKNPYAAAVTPRVVMNFVDIAGNKSLPVAYFVCSDKCQKMVSEIVNSESTNFSRLMYEETEDVY